MRGENNLKYNTTVTVCNADWALSGAHINAHVTSECLAKERVGISFENMIFLQFCVRSRTGVWAIVETNFSVYVVKNNISTNDDVILALVDFSSISRKSFSRQLIIRGVCVCVCTLTSPSSSALATDSDE